MKFIIAFPKIILGVEYTKRICKDIFSVAGQCKKHIYQILGGPGVDFLRGIAFLSIRSSILGR